MGQKTLQGQNVLDGWFNRHREDYQEVLGRLARARSVTLAGSRAAAAENLRKSYLFAVLSIQTDKDRHERAFTRACSDADVREAATDTVYGNQKADWIETTLESTDWESVATAVRAHVRHGRTEALLDMCEHFTGVSYRKWAFTLAMCGVWEVCCIDSNVAAQLGISARAAESPDKASAADYVRLIERVRESVDVPAPPFLIQWAVYDCARGEHARHMAFFREINLA